MTFALIALAVFLAFAAVFRPQRSDPPRKAAPPPPSGPRPSAHLTARRVALELFVKRAAVSIPVPDLIFALMCPRDRAVRTIVQARNAIMELSDDGLLELAEISREHAVRSGLRFGLYLPASRSTVYGIAVLTITLDRARAELAAGDAWELAS